MIDSFFEMLDKDFSSFAEANKEEVQKETIKL
jgi:hypothetical protein